MPTITEAIEDAAIDGIQSHTVDGRTTVAKPIAELIAADKHVKGKDALAGSNSNGGARSGWNGLRPAQAIFRGPSNG